MSIYEEIQILDKSNYKIILHLIIFIMIVLFTFFSLNFFYWVFITFLLAISWKISSFSHLNSSKIKAVAYFDEKIWTIKFIDDSIKRYEYEKIVNHRVYIIIFFKKPYKPILIWQDQVSKKSWKKLTVFSLLNDLQ